MFPTTGGSAPPPPAGLVPFVDSSILNSRIHYINTFCPCVSTEQGVPQGRTMIFQWYCISPIGHMVSSCKSPIFRDTFLRVVQLATGLLVQFPRVSNIYEGAPVRGQIRLPTASSSCIFIPIPVTYVPVVFERHT